MKKIMKKALSLALVLVMMLTLAPMTAKAATGEADDPYMLDTVNRLAVTVAPGETAWVKATDGSGKVTVGYATSADYMLMYGRMPVYPNVGGTAELQLTNYPDFSVYNPSETDSVTLYMVLEAGAGVTTGTWDNPEVVEFEYDMAETTATFEGGEDMPYFIQVEAPADGKLAITAYAEYVGADYVSYPVGYNLDVTNQRTCVQTSITDEEGYDTYNVKKGDIVLIAAMTSDHNSHYAVPGDLVVSAMFFGVGSSSNPEVIEDDGDYTATITNEYADYCYTYVAPANGTITVTMGANNTNGWTYLVEGTTSVGVINSVDGADKATGSVDVLEGTEVTIYISTYDPNAYAYPLGTVDWTFDFTPGEVEGPVVGESAENPNPLTNGSGTVTVAPGATYYFYHLPEDGEGTYTVSVEGATGFEVGLYDVPNAAQASMYADVNGVVEKDITTSKFAQYIQFHVVNNTNKEQTYNVSVVGAASTPGQDGPVDEVAVGTIENPAKLAANNMNTALYEYVSYYFEYTATKAGTLSVVANESLTQITDLRFDYSVSGPDNFTGAMYASLDLEVKVGDKVLIEVTSSNNAPQTGNVVLLASFTDKVVTPEKPGTDSPSVDNNKPGVNSPSVDNNKPGVNSPSVDNNKPGTSKPTYGEETKDGFFYNYKVLSGASYYIVELEPGYDVTLYEYTPITTGTYTFKVSNGTVGYYGTNVWFPFNEAELTSTVTVNYTDANLMSAIVLGFTGEDLTMVDVIREGDAKEESKLPEYTPVVSASTYVFLGNTADLEYVNVLDKTEDKAVLGKDGYYHLNTVDGPILLINLFDDVLSLGNATATGKVAVSIYEEGKVVGIYNYNNLIDTYAACADKTTGLYPLTAELMELYQVYGEQQEWYKETGYVGGQLKLGNAADAWMFACMYVPNAEDGTIVVPPVVIPPTVAVDNVVSGEVIDFWVQNAVASNNPSVAIPTTNNAITMIFNVSDLKDVESVDLNIEVNVKQDVEDETVAKNENITTDNFVLKIEFSHSGKLPGKATIQIAIPEAIAKDLQGIPLYYHKIMEDGSLKFICETELDENNKVAVTQDSCSDYVLLTEKFEEVVDPIVPDTGDATNFTLWISVLGLGVLAIAASLAMKKREI